MATKSLFCNLITCLVILIISYGCAGSQPVIIKAASSGDINSIKKMRAEGQNINERDSGGSTALMHAIWNGKTDAVKYLIESGADIKAKDKSGCDALISAADNGQIEIVKTLLDRGANIESKDNANSTPLMHAVVSGHYGITELLLDRGANIESKDWSGATPIANAAKGSASKKILQLLIKKGANLNVKDTEGYTPLGWAVFYKQMDLATEIKKAMADARKGMPSARIVFVRESNVLIPGEMQDVFVYIDEQVVANLSRNSTDYIDVSPGKCTMVIKGGKLEGNHVKSFDAVSGQTYYFAVSQRFGSFLGSMGGAVGSWVESQSAGEEAGPFKITPLEESVAKEKIKVLLKNN